jgi:predicted nucleotidyltransferase
MGKIFSYREVEGRLFPNFDDFHCLDRFLLKKLSECDKVIAGARLGSFLRGDHNVRSDYDCVILVKNSNDKEVLRIEWEINEFASCRAIPLEFIVVDLRLADSDMHTIENGFSRHIEWAVNNGGVIKDNPLKYLRVKEGYYEEELKNYLRYKWSKLRKRWSRKKELSESAYLKFLQKVLEIPVYTARKILRWSGVNLDFDDSKKQIIDLYQKEFSHWGGVDLFKEAIAIDRAYTEYIEKLPKSNKEWYRADYCEELVKIEKSIPLVLEFLLINMLNISKNKH